MHKPSIRATGRIPVNDGKARRPLKPRRVLPGLFGRELHGGLLERLARVFGLGR